MWRKTTVGPSETIEVCDKPFRRILVTEVHKPPPEASVCHHAEEKEAMREQLHGPECEKHCYSTPLMCHVKQEPGDMMQPTSVNAALAAMSIEQKHLHHGGKRVHFAPEVCHFDPKIDDRCDGKGKRHFLVEKHRTHSAESDDCGNVPYHQRKNFSTQLQTSSYIDDGQGYSTPMNQGQTSKFCHQEKHYSPPKYESACSMNSQLHCPDYENRGFENYPMYPGKSPAVHIDEGYSHSRNNDPGYPKSNQPDDCDRGLKDLQRGRETSHNVSFKKNNTHLPNSGQQYSENNETHQLESGRHGLVHGPSLLGHYHCEGIEYVGLPVCAEACHSIGFDENKSPVCETSHQVNHSGISERHDANQVPGRYDSSPSLHQVHHQVNSSPVCETGHQENCHGISEHSRENQVPGRYGSSPNLHQGNSSPGHQVSCPEISEHQNQVPGLQVPRKSRSCTHSNELNLCEDTKYHQRWWKAGSYDHSKSKGSWDVRDVPHQLMKPLRPPYITMTKKDFKQPMTVG